MILSPADGATLPVTTAGIPPIAFQNPGLKMPRPPDGFGLVVVDFDKTLLEGDSHMQFIGHGLWTRGKVLLHLDGMLNRLLQGLTMTARYRTHTLNPGAAREAVGTLLDGLPILEIAKEWADARARDNIKRGILREVHETARKIVQEEVRQLIKQGAMSAPLSDEDLEQEARSRIFIVSSQFKKALQFLTCVGDEKENLLDILPGHILGSDGTFDEKGVFSFDEHFEYGLLEEKRRIFDEEMTRRGIHWDPNTTATFSDDVHYDRSLLAIARDPANRTIVDPGRGDSRYAESERTRVSYDLPDFRMRGHWALKPQGGKKLVIDEQQSFSPDNPSVVTGAEAWNRAFWGVLEMTPTIAAEALLHGGIHGDFHPAALVLPIGAGLLYGPLNRGRIVNFVVGALLSGGMTAAHGSAHPITSAALGSVSFAATHFVVRRIHFEKTAREVGPKGFTRWTRGISFFERAGVTTAWSTALRYLGLG